MGLEYLITKKVLDEIKKNKLDYEGLPFDYSSVHKKTIMYNAISFLIGNTGLEREYNRNSKETVDNILKCLQNIARYYKEDYKTKGSSAMFSFLLYYQYKKSALNPHKWLFENSIHNIIDDDLQTKSLIILYEAALNNKARNLWEEIKCWTSFIWKLRKLFTPLLFWKNK